MVVVEPFEGFLQSPHNLIWKSHNKGCFTVIWWYLFLKWGRQQGNFWPCGQIQRTYAPCKVACFAQLVVLKGCLTHENFKKEDFSYAPSVVWWTFSTKNKCYVVKTQRLLIIYFLHCHSTGQLWQLFLNMMAVQWTMPSDTWKLLRCWNINRKNIRPKKLSIPAFMW